MKCLIIAMLLLMPCMSYAATGDIIFQCNFSASTTPSTAVTSCGAALDQSSTFDILSANGRLYISTTGGRPGGDGYYIYNQHDSAPTDDNDHIFTVSLGSGRTEITAEYWEKFSVWPILNGNTKGCRFYDTGNGGDAYYMAPLSAHYNTYWYTSVFTIGTMTPTSYVTSVRTGHSEDCASNGDGTYTCPNPALYGTGRVEVKWSTDGGTTDGYGTVWRKVRVYAKLPSTSSSRDGIQKLWIDDHEIFTVEDIQASVSGGQTFTGLNFYPSDASTSTGWYHAYDDITVYEGYVPPGDAPSPSTGSLRPGVSALGVTFR